MEDRRQTPQAPAPAEQGLTTIKRKQMQTLQQSGLVFVCEAILVSTREYHYHQPSSCYLMSCTKAKEAELPIPCHRTRSKQHRAQQAETWGSWCRSCT